MSGEDMFWTFLVLLGLFLAISSGCYKGGKKVIQVQAVREGLGRWEVDVKGDTEFKWNKELIPAK